MMLAERGASASLVCDEFVAKATNEEQNKLADVPQPANTVF